MEITYDSIKSLIVSEEIEGQMIKLKFKATNQDSPIETIAMVMPDQDEIMKKAMMQAGKSAATGMAVNTAGNLLGSAIGGIGGAITSQVGSAAASQASSAAFNSDSLMQTEMTDAKKQAAIVQAFGYLASYYKHNGSTWEFVQPTPPAG